MKLYFIILMSFVVFIGGLNSQVTDNQFGKNRVQYHNDFKDWWMYESENFITYWYGKARNVGQAAMQIAEMDYENIVNIIEHRTNEKIEIIAYVDLTDIKQSNIGSEELFGHTTGKTKIVGNKLFIYFNGDHKHLRQQLREGIATIILEGMLYGSNLQEIVQNAVFLNVPDWYKKGLVSYIASKWNQEMEHSLSLIFEQNSKIDFEELAYEYPEVIGHSFWYFIAERYGSSTIANLLYLTRINRDLNNAFLFVIGQPIERLIEEWELFYSNQISSINQESRLDLPFKIKRNRRISFVKTNIATQDIVYATNNLGKVKVYSYDGKKTKCFFKTGYCNRVQSADLNYPIVEWTPDGKNLMLIYEKRDQIYLRKYNLPSYTFEEQVLPNDLQRVYDIAVASKNEIYFTGSNNGLSDIFKYTPRTRQYIKVTDDFYDDLEIEYYIYGEYQGLVFTSNRPNTTLIHNQKLDMILPLANRNIFYYPLSKNDKKIIQITDSELGDKMRLKTFGDEELYFLSNKSGLWNKRYISIANVLEVDKVGGSVDFGYDGKPVTGYGKNIDFFYFNPWKKKWYDIFYLENKYIMSISVSDGVGEKISSFSNKFRKEPDNIKDSRTYILDYFDSKFENPLFEDEDSKKSSTKYTDKVAQYQYNDEKGSAKIKKFVFARAVASRIRFKIDYFNALLDNSLLFGGLDTYAGTKMEFEKPPLGILLKANLKDIFEDYVVEGGTRITTSFNGSEHFLTFMDKKYRMDKLYSLYRRSVKTLIGEGQFDGLRARNVTSIGVFQLRYPFDVYRSVRGSVTFRNDRYNILSTNRSSLEAPILDEQRLGLKVEYIFDNTIEIDINIKNGIRYKFYSEIVKKMALNFSPFNLDFAEGFMTIVGGDARFYLPILKHSIFAVRLHGATSFGSEQVLFFAGGIENWLFPSFNQNSTFPPDDNYAYQTIATNIRGFEYNIRNGGTYAIGSFELRFPLTRYLTRKKLRFAPLDHLQFSAFFDMGMAWFGRNPLAKENPANTAHFSNPAVDLDVQYYRDPLIMGYGWGVRTLIFGYYLKFDYSWGVETRRVNKPIWYLSLGTDF